MVKNTEKQDEKQEEESSNKDQTQLLNLAKTNLNHRNFTLSRQYSLQLLSSATNHRSHRAVATQILTISDILSSNNHYSTLQIDPFSTDHNLIRTQFKKLLFILNPIKPSSTLAQEAFDCVQQAFNCLKDPVKKAVHDTEIRNPMACDNGDGNCHVGFWTFCPYCFYVYEYDKVYEGCSLRCQNENCRRVFHGVGLTSLPKMELDKGHYFGCFGYFPMGFKPGIDGIDEMSKFQSWTPLVSNGMFPSNNHNDNYSNKMKGTSFDDRTNFIEILDESDDDDECNVGVKGGSFEENVTSVERDKPRGVRRKSVALNARRKRRNIVSHANANANDNANVANDNASGCGERLFLDESENLVEEFVLENDHGVVGVRGGGNVDDLNEGDMAFFEGGGDIFLMDLASDE